MPTENDSEPTNQNDQKIASVTLAREDYPFGIVIKDEDTGEVLWDCVVEGPGPLEVPGFAPRKCEVYVATPDGEITVTDSSGQAWVITAKEGRHVEGC